MKVRTTHSLAQLASMSATTASNVFSICIPKALPIDWREVKQLWYVRFPDDEVEQVDVVPYKSDHALAGFVKIFVHWCPQSDAAVKMRSFCELRDKNVWMVNGPAWGEGGVEKWACSRSTVARKVRKQKEVASVHEVEYEEPYEEAPQTTPSPVPSPPPSPPSPPSSTAPCGPRPPPVFIPEF